MAKLAIKSDNRKQNLLLPPSLDELVPENHMVRVVDAVIDRLDISDILSTYRGGGNSAFNPKMMLKVLVFAYLSNVYSSRRIEELLKRDIYFMWLAGMKRPDFRTINYYYCCPIKVFLGSEKIRAGSICRSPPIVVTLLL